MWKAIYNMSYIHYTIIIPFKHYILNPINSQISFQYKYHGSTDSFGLFTNKYTQPGKLAESRTVRATMIKARKVPETDGRIINNQKSINSDLSLS